MTDIKLIFQ